ncbi:MAG: DUF58 domain-containing protein [Planctomycetaceae bacterium]
MPGPTNKFLDPSSLARMQNLSLAARTVVEGFFSGMHRSPQKGFSVEFAEHRQYTPGVDPRHIDWRVFGRRDKLYIKQYEEETSLRCYLVIDSSASMNYHSPGVITKLEYASYLAASLAYLAVFQHDAVGLTTFNTKIHRMVPPRQGAGHLKNLMQTLEAISPGQESHIGDVLHQLAETAKRRSLVIVFSDFFDDLPDVLSGLQHLRHRKHDVIVFHTLDPTELTFPFHDVTRVVDMETNREVLSDPQAFRQAYLEEFTRFQQDLRAGCLASQIDYSLAETNQPFDSFLGQYLATREHQQVRARTN